MSARPVCFAAPTGRELGPPATARARGASVGATPLGVASESAASSRRSGISYRSDKKRSEPEDAAWRRPGGPRLPVPLPPSPVPLPPPLVPLPPPPYHSAPSSAHSASSPKPPHFPWRAAVLIRVVHRRRGHAGSRREPRHVMRVSVWEQTRREERHAKTRAEPHSYRRGRSPLRHSSGNARSSEKVRNNDGVFLFADEADEVDVSDASDDASSSSVAESANVAVGLFPAPPHPMTRVEMRLIVHTRVLAGHERRLPSFDDSSRSRGWS